MPLRFAFGIHLHQPVGNFDFVFEEHVRDVYRPLLSAIAEREFLPITVHISGPLLEWLEEHDAPMLDLVGSLAAEDRIELLASGMYEPVLVALPRADRVEQVEWMRERLQSLFGVDARGAWLTERVWEQELAEDLSRAGIDYTLLDDRHFLVSGFQRGQLHRPLLTESDGRRLALFSIDEKLRYLIPFRAPQETVRYLRELRGGGPATGRPGGRRREVRRLARHPAVGVRGRVARTLLRHDGDPHRWRRASACHLLNGPSRGGERRPRLPAQRIVPRDGGMVAADRGVDAPHAPAPGARRGPYGASRRRPGPVALTGATSSSATRRPTGCRRRWSRSRGCAGVAATRRKPAERSGAPSVTMPIGTECSAASTSPT